MDWQPIQSIIGIFNVYHAYVGEQIFQGRTHGALAKQGIFFYDMFYFEPVLPTSWGRLSPLSLPSFKEWVLPGTITSESYRVKLSKEIQKSLKATMATKKVKIAIFMPIEVFADFFHDEEVRTTPTMFLCNSEKALEMMGGIRCKQVESFWLYKSNQLYAS